jgi:hypothetical protein
VSVSGPAEAQYRTVQWSAVEHSEVQRSRVEMHAVRYNTTPKQSVRSVTFVGVSCDHTV